MDETPKTNAATGDESLVLAKILLRKFNILHEFHVHQLQMYLIACCTAAIGGEVAINADEHLVAFEIKTNFFYKRVKGKIVKRHPMSPILLFKRLDKMLYAHEVRVAHMSLENWTKELLWGDDTRVKVTIDGRSIEIEQ